MIDGAGLMGMPTESYDRTTRRGRPLPRLPLRLSTPAGRQYRPALVVEVLHEVDPGPPCLPPLDPGPYRVEVSGPVVTKSNGDHPLYVGRARWHGATITDLLARGLPPELLPYLVGPGTLRSWRAL